MPNLYVPEAPRLGTRLILRTASSGLGTSAKTPPQSLLQSLLVRLTRLRPQDAGGYETKSHRR